MGYCLRKPRSCKSHRRSCCKAPTSMESKVALMAGLMEETKAATSICRSHTTGWPATYNQEVLALLISTLCPRLSSFPLPCQVTSAVSVPSAPKTTPKTGNYFGSNPDRWSYPVLTYMHDLQTVPNGLQALGAFGMRQPRRRPPQSNLICYPLSSYKGRSILVPILSKITVRWRL